MNIHRLRIVAAALLALVFICGAEVRSREANPPAFLYFQSGIYGEIKPCA